MYIAKLHDESVNGLFQNESVRNKNAFKSKVQVA